MPSLSQQEANTMTKRMSRLNFEKVRKNVWYAREEYLNYEISQHSKGVFTLQITLETPDLFHNSNYFTLENAIEAAREYANE